MRKPKWHYRTEFMLDGVWIFGRYFTRKRAAVKWVNRAKRAGWEARLEKVAA